MRTRGVVVLIAGGPTCPPAVWTLIIDQVPEKWQVLATYTGPLGFDWRRKSPSVTLYAVCATVSGPTLEDPPGNK